MNGMTRRNWLRKTKRCSICRSKTGTRRKPGTMRSGPRQITLQKRKRQKKKARKNSLAQTGHPFFMLSRPHRPLLQMFQPLACPLAETLPTVEIIKILKKLTRVSEM